MKLLDRLATILLVLSGLTWGGVGAADFNPFMWIFISMPKLLRFVYLAFGLAALWKIGRGLVRK